MRSAGIVVAAGLLAAGLVAAGLGLTRWAMAAPLPDQRRSRAVLALDGSKSMEGFHRAGSLDRVVRAFQESASAAGLGHEALIFTSVDRVPGPPLWRSFQTSPAGQAGSGREPFQGAFTHLPEAFDHIPEPADFVFFLTDNLDNLDKPDHLGAAGNRLVRRFRGGDVAAVLAVPMSLPFDGEVFEEDLKPGCPPWELDRLIRAHPFSGPPGGRRFWYQKGRRGLIAYLVVRDPRDPVQRRALVGPATGLLRELARREVFHAPGTGQFPLLPLKCFPDGLWGEAGAVGASDPTPLDLSAPMQVDLTPLRLVLPDLLPGVAVRAGPPPGAGDHPLTLMGPPRAELAEPEQSHASWLRGGSQPVCDPLPRAVGDSPDTLRLRIRLGPLRRDPVGPLDWDRFLHLAWRSTSPVLIHLQLRSRLHASVLETSPAIQEALLSANTCELAKVGFPLGRDPVLMLAPEDDQHLRLHQRWKVVLEGRHPFWAGDTAWFVAVWGLVGLLGVAAAGLVWLRVHARRFKCQVTEPGRKPDWSQVRSVSLRPGGRPYRLPRYQGREIGSLALTGLGQRLRFLPADPEVRRTDGRSDPAQIAGNGRLELDLPREESITPIASGCDYGRKKVCLWVKRL